MDSLNPWMIGAYGLFFRVLVNFTIDNRTATALDQLESLLDEGRFTDATTSADHQHLLFTFRRILQNCIILSNSFVLP